MCRIGPERGPRQLCDHLACPAVDHQSHDEPVIARIWCMCLATKVGVTLIVSLLILTAVSKAEKIIEQMRRSPRNVRFDDLAKICADHFGEPGKTAPRTRSTRRRGKAIHA
jgi:hypothetical protein